MDSGMPPIKKKSKLVWIIVGACALVAVVAAVFLVPILLDSQKPKRITISFNTGGAGEIESMQISRGSSIELPSVSRDGYDFVGWYNGANVVNNSTTFESNTTLVARWISGDGRFYVVLFETSGGNQVNPLVLDCGAKIKLPSEPEKSGHTFKGWVNLVGDDIKDNSKLACENTTLIAVWEKGDGEDDGPINMDPGPVPAEKITLDKSALSIIVKESATLVATIIPENASNKGVIWSSSDPNIVSVKGGKLAAKGVGKVTITAKTVNGKTATAEISSDVSSITVKADRQYIAKYTELGAKNKATVTVKTVPDIDIDASMIIWNKNSSGVSVSNVKENGKSATITALENTGSMEPLQISVKIGEKTSNIETIYVEPKLALSGPTQVSSGKKVTIHSTVDINSDDWDVNGVARTQQSFAESKVARGNEYDFTPRCSTWDKNDFIVDATSRAGQKASYTVTCTSK